MGGMIASDRAPFDLTRCRGCGAKQRSLTDWRCACGGLYSLHRLRYRAEEVDRDRVDLSRYRSFIPLAPDAITLEAGWTPVRRARLLGGDVWVKEETRNPSGSFKDRGMVVLANLAAGADGPAFVDSIGNTGLALAMYAAALRIDAHVFAPLATSEDRARLITERGARLHRVAGPRAECGKVALAAAEDGALYLSHIFQPLFQAGTATAAFELHEQLPEVPERVFVPVGQGTLLLGLWHGYRALLAAGVIDRLPALFAARPVHPGRTRAIGASAVHPIRAQEVRDAAKATGGDVVRIDEAALTAADAEMQDAGLDTDPTCALALAAWRAVRRAHDPPHDVLMLTGALRETGGH
jgi:threonine synthase